MPEQISVIICTKDRPNDIGRAVRALLVDESPFIDLVVVDQSDGDETEIALRPITDGRLRYFRTMTRGKGFALNEGLSQVESRFVACTDDDCEPDSGWIGRIVQPLIDHPEVALVFSRVEAPDHDRTLGYIPVFLPPHDRLLTRPRSMCARWGLGAGMAFRRDVVTELGGFDESFGPGGRFPSGDDFDLELRLLLKGWHVYEHAGARVIHYGFRTKAEGRAHTVRDWRALGASCGKAVRSGYFVALVMATTILWTRALWPSLQAVVHRHRPPLRRVSAFTSGFFAGLAIPVDHENLLHILPQAAPSTTT